MEAMTSFMLKASKLAALLLLLPALAWAQTSGPSPVFNNTQATSYVKHTVGGTGTDTVTFTNSTNYQWWTLASSTNQTFALVDGRSPASGAFDRDVLKVCQTSGGQDTEAFSNTELGASGTGWSNQTQRGYTLTASRCDIYCFDWNTTYHDCGFLSDAPQ